MSTGILSSLILLPIYFGWIVCLISVPILLTLPFTGISIFAMFRFFETNKALEHNDRAVREKKIEDDGSKIVSFSKRFPNQKSLNLSGRKKVGILLSKADKLLPEGVYLKILNCYRSAEQENDLEKSHADRLKKNDPNVPDGFIQDEMSKLNKEYFSDGHCTGGAVDITLMDKWGHELDLGKRQTRRLNWRGKIYLSTASNHSECNRSVLAAAMKQVGFVPHQTEWWHWSYGDQYWCASVGAKSAIYGRV
jgi:zinc D-Ala-D-Ala dipeptidase